MKHWVRTVFEDISQTNDCLPNRSREDVKRIIDLIENSEVYHFRTAELETMANQLSESEGLTELSELMWHTTIALGFQNFAIFVLKQGSGTSFEPRICTSFNSEWISRYVDQRYQYVDPVMANASVHEGWFLYSELKNCSPAVESFWQDAEEHRIGRNGVCFSIRRRDGTHIGVSFSTQNTAEKVENIFHRNCSDMGFLAKIASDAFCYAASRQFLPDDTLTETELRFLHILSTSQNPKDALQVSSCFGSNNSLQASIRSKMGTESVFQAVAIAASKGWFDLLPYGLNEIAKPFAPLRGLELECEKPEGKSANLLSYKSDV